MIDFQKIASICLKRWWVFLISLIVCGGIATWWYARTPDKFAIEASLMIRQVDDNSTTNQDQMIKMMGGGGNKVVIDEIKVLTSQSLMEPIIRELGLTTQYEIKRGLKWQNLYPNKPFTVCLEEPQIGIVRMWIDIEDGQYDIQTRTSFFDRSNYSTTDLSQSFETCVGKVHIEMPACMPNGQYRITITPVNIAVAQYQQMIDVKRQSRESNIIAITTENTCPQLAEDVINHMLDSYNLQTAKDKNIVATQTDEFLSNRLEVITDELNQAEGELEEYKRLNHITNLDDIAEAYRETCEQYDLEIADLDAKIKLLDYTASEISNVENRGQAFPFIDGELSPTLTSLINDYNTHIGQLNTLLRTANEAHPMVQQESELIEQKRLNIESNIAQSRQTLVLKKEKTQEQKEAYQSRLESIPEQDRIYREMKRTKTTKENQYVYLIEQREENAMLMASAAIPAITIDRAHVNPEKIAPKMKTLAAIALIMGLLLPILYWVLRDYLAHLFNKQKKE